MFSQGGPGTPKKVSRRRTSSGGTQQETARDASGQGLVPQQGNCATPTLRKDLLQTVFSHLTSLDDLRHCMLVCKFWYDALREDENGEAWETHCLRLCQDAATLRSPLLLPLGTWLSKLRALCHGWSRLDCSRNIVVKSCGLTLHRNPVAQSTDGARAKRGFSEGRHCWEVVWGGPLGTVAVVGIATKLAPLQVHGYVALLGSSENSWGWNIVENNLVHHGAVQGPYPTAQNPAKYQIGERIRVILDCEDRCLAFEKGVEFLGVAFHGLPSGLLYPAVSAVYGNTEVSIVYLGPPLDG